MNRCCYDCDKKLIPKKIKDLFNELANVIFIECPLNDKNVCGCTIKYLDIDWKNFVKYLKKNNHITIKEIKDLEQKGVI